ncbi:hypothetical protein LINPERPRIM_LOCUS37904, partial [Linum perenne]
QTLAKGDHRQWHSSLDVEAFDGSRKRSSGRRPGRREREKASAVVPIRNRSYDDGSVSSWVGGSDPWLRWRRD